MNYRDDTAKRTILAQLTPLKLAAGLRLKPERRGRDVGVLCPLHGEKNSPSMSFKQYDGSVGIKCFGCQWTGDALSLIAATHGLSGGADFPDVLALAADMAGLPALADELRGGKPADRSQLPPIERSGPVREHGYPDHNEVMALWATCIPVTEDPGVSGMLVGRRIDPDAVAQIDAARALSRDTFYGSVPRWARHKGKMDDSLPWTRSGHRAIVPVYDHEGSMVSVRAWMVDENPHDLPKRVPPAGHKASGVVLANPRALRWLRGEASPSAITVVEGEPDFLVRSLTFTHESIVGIGSGSWSFEFAERVPYGSQVSLLTHIDDAGNRYADAIAESISRRAQVFRWTISKDEAAA